MALASKARRRAFLIVNLLCSRGRIILNRDRCNLGHVFTS